MKELPRSLLECLVVFVVGTGLALAANALSPRGLKIMHNYFPVVHTQPSPYTGPLATQSAPEGVVIPSNYSEAIQRLAAQGIATISDAEAWEAFQDPAYAEGQIVFIDARTEQRYTEGHIPGAYHYYYLNADSYVDKVLPAAFGASKVIVYCGGGDCEDSEFAAIDLRNRGVDQSRLFVYLGGIAEWHEHGRPIRQGDHGQPGGNP